MGFYYLIMCDWDIGMDMGGSYPDLLEYTITEFTGENCVKSRKSQMVYPASRPEMASPVLILGLCQ
jgi:hypothetical protein